ncbi:MAG: hypothetical protein O3B13_08760 [Planctomycetota bacterium]|nr:hypothetical protein [Planctomycetota bacterium]
MRSYITVDRKKGWTFRDDEYWDPTLLELKRKTLDEAAIQDFLHDSNLFYDKALDSFKNGIPRALTPSLQDHLKTLRERLRLPIRLELPFRFANPQCNVAGFEELADSLVERIPNEAQLKPYLNQRDGRLGVFSESQKAELKQIGGTIRKSLSEAIKPLTQYTDILFAFYQSSVVLDLLEVCPDFDRELYHLELEEQRKERKLSSVDVYLLLWIIHLITAGSRSKDRAAPLPLYSHVVIDEAQYYEPILLRLFTDLVKHEDREGVVTIVGDLEQRISSKGGVMSWAELGLELDESQIARLVTNYRWTVEVFEFLSITHKALGISESLNRPFKWRVADGRQPEIDFISNDNSEVELICDRINEIRDDPKAQNWTVVVVVAYGDSNKVQREIKDGLDGFGIPAKCATGDEVRETVDKVIITNCDSIVGLEFDCVCVVGAQILFAECGESVEIGRHEALREAWVALTRAKRFLYITTTDNDPVLTLAEFDRYRR